MEIKKVNLFNKSAKKRYLSIGSGCVIVKDGKVLLVSGNGPKFKFPGGHIDDSENFKESAKRELLEELNCSVNIVDGPLFYMYEKDEETDILLIHYKAEIVEGEPTASSEIERVGWFDLNKLPDVFDNVPLILKKFGYLT